MAKEEPELQLTDSNKTYILANIDTVDLIDMVRYISGDPKADGRHKIGRLIREFVLSQGLKLKTTRYEKMEELELTQAQKEFCQNNADKMKPLEITKLAFNNEKLTPLSREFKVIYQYLKEIAPNFIKKNDRVVEDDEYKTPNSVYDLIDLVNLYVRNPKKENEPMYDRATLTAQDERNLRALLSYISIPRFTYQANQYLREVDRELYLSTFIGMTYDKPDLFREDVDQYISLAAEIVNTAQIDRHIQQLDQEIEDHLTSNSTEKKKLSMALVELVNTARDKQDKSKERQRRLITELSGSRGKRLEHKIAANSSILNLVEEWSKEKERMAYIELAELQKQAEAEQVDRMITMEDVVCLIAGITRDELIN